MNPEASCLTCCGWMAFWHHFQIKTISVRLGLLCRFAIQMQIHLRTSGINFVESDTHLSEPIVGNKKVHGTNMEMFLHVAQCLTC